MIVGSDNLSTMGSMYFIWIVFLIALPIFWKLIAWKDDTHQEDISNVSKKI